MLRFFNEAHTFLKCAGRTQGPGPNSLEGDREGTINLVDRRSGHWGDHGFGVTLWWVLFCSDGDVGFRTGRGWSAGGRAEHASSIRRSNL